MKIKCTISEKDFILDMLPGNCGNCTFREECRNLQNNPDISCTDIFRALVEWEIIREN